MAVSCYNSARYIYKSMIFGSSLTRRKVCLVTHIISIRLVLIFDFFYFKRPECRITLETFTSAKPTLKKQYQYKFNHTGDLVQPCGNVWLKSNGSLIKVPAPSLYYRRSAPSDDPMDCVRCCLNQHEGLDQPSTLRII